MRILPLIITSLTVSSLGLINSSNSLATETIAQLGNLEELSEVTTSVLDRLGYDCEDVAGVGIVCKKCSSESVVSEKCTAYICDAATKKCRKKEGSIPKLPESNN